MNRAEEIITVAFVAVICALAVFLFGMQIGYEMALK